MEKVLQLWTETGKKQLKMNTHRERRRAVKEEYPQSGGGLG